VDFLVFVFTCKGVSISLGFPFLFFRKKETKLANSGFAKRKVSVKKLPSG